MFYDIVITIILLFHPIFFPAISLENKYDMKDFPFYVGTYTHGESEGIYLYQLQSDGALKKLGLAAKSENPSYLAKSQNGKYLLAVNENNNDAGGGGTISSFSIEGNELKFIDKKSSGGASPCFVSINPANYVLTANYGNGSVALYKLETAGVIDGPLDILQHEGQGTNPRQEGPHAHSAWFTGSNNEVITVDLGTNELWFSKLDINLNKLAPMNPQKLAMAPGSGPRHLTFHPARNWIYVINELTSTISQLWKNTSGQYEIASSQSTIPVSYKGVNTTADIHISNDGKFLYASNRGHNSIVIFKINQKDGSMILVGNESVHGDGPRNFTLSPNGNFLLVANQQSNNIVSFKRNKKKGTLEFVNEIAAPSPVCLLF